MSDIRWWKKEVAIPSNRVNVSYVDGWTLEEALKSAENSGAVIFWATIERKVNLKIKL